MPVTADEAGAVIAEAERIAREAVAADEAKARRKARKAERQRQRADDQERKAAEQAGRERARRAEAERLRAEAGESRKVLLRKARALRDAAGGASGPASRACPSPATRTASAIPSRPCWPSW